MSPDRNAVTIVGVALAASGELIALGSSEFVASLLPAKFGDASRLA
jgi:hypothetical protein